MPKNESGLVPINKPVEKIVQDGYEGRNWFAVNYGQRKVYVRAKTAVAAKWTAAKAFGQRAGDTAYYMIADVMRLKGEP